MAKAYPIYAFDATSSDEAAPNPYISLFANITDKPTSVRWNAQRQRRSEILAAARKLISELGVDGISVRRLSAEAGISVQTIYNLVGSRAHVLAGAVEEYTRAMIQCGQRHGARKADYLPLGHVRIMWESAEQFPEFTKTLNAAYYSPGSPLYPIMNKLCYDAFYSFLREMEASERLRPNASIKNVAFTMTQMCAAYLHDWCETHQDAGQLKVDLINGQALILLGAVSREESVLIEQKMADWFCQCDQHNTATSNFEVL